MCAVGFESDSFKRAKNITWKQLAALPLIAGRRGYGVRHRMDVAAGEANVQLRIIQEVSLLMTAIALARAGVGIAVVPETLLAYTANREGLVSRRIVRPMVERHISLLTLKDRTLSPAAAAFRDIVFSVGDE